MTDKTQARASELLTSAAAMVYQDTAYANHDWEYIALVYDLVGDGEGCFGYVFRRDGSWTAETPDDPEFVILDRMLDLRAVMAEAGGAKWLRALLHIDSEAEMNVQFEYDDPARWTIRPSDLSASVEALRPRSLSVPRQRDLQAVRPR